MIDIDECKNPNQCSTAEANDCRNHIGSYTCECSRGYIRMVDAENLCIGIKINNNILLISLKKDITLEIIKIFILQTTACMTGNV